MCVACGYWHRGRIFACITLLGIRIYIFRCIVVCVALRKHESMRCHCVRDCYACVENCLYDGFSTKGKCSMCSIERERERARERTEKKHDKWHSENECKHLK